MAEIVKDLDFWRFTAMGQFIKTVLWGQAQEIWETLFEGTVTVPEGSTATLASGSIGLTDGATIRLTVNGVSAVFTVQTYTISSYGSQTYVGNLYLWGNVGDDTGFDYLVMETSMFGTVMGAEFYSRNSGSYSVKVERLVG